MGWLYISITTFQAINANQIFARQNILSERPDTMWAPPHITSLCNSGNTLRQSNSTRKLWSLEKLHNLICSPLLLFSIQKPFSVYVLSTFLYFPSASQLSYNPMVFFKSCCLPLIPGIPLSRESQGIPGDQTIPVDTSGQKQYLPYHRITITSVIKMRLPVSKVTLAVQFLPSLNSSGSLAFEIM